MSLWVGGRRPAPEPGGQPRLPLLCPVCQCERVEPDGRGINCTCSNCGASGNLSLFRRGWLDLVAPLSGSPNPPADLFDLVEFQEHDPDYGPPVWDLPPELDL